MAIQIKLKNSVVQDSTPSTSDLPAVGELALNANINSIGGFMRASNNTIVKIFGPGSVTTPTATTTVSGISELATNSETTTGTATNRVVTPAGLNAVTVAERSTSNTNYVAKAGSTMTGALLVTNGTVSANSISPSGDANTGFNFGTDTVNICTAGANRLTVNSSGEIITTGNILIDGDGDRLKLGDGQDFQLYHTGTTNRIQSFVGDIELLAPTGKAVLFGINSVEKARIDSSGRLLIGSSTSVDVASSAASLLQVEHTSGNISAAFYSTVNATGPAGTLALGHARGSASGILLEDDSMGHIRFAGGDGVDLETVGAQIAGEVDGTPGANDMPGRLVFSTTADGASSPTTRLTIDSAGLVKIPDDGKFVAGAGDDLQIHHDGSDTYIDNNTGNLNIVCDSNQAINLRHGSENMLRAITDGAVELYYDNSKKFETFSGGVSITGSVNADQLHLGDNDKALFGNSNDLQIYHDGSTNIIDGQFHPIEIRHQSERHILCVDDGAVELYHNNSKKFETTSGGATVTGTLTATSFSGDGSSLSGINTDLVSDTSPQLGNSLDMNGQSINGGDSAGTTSNRIKLGTGDDFQFYHNGSHSFIQNSTNYIYYLSTQHHFKNAADNELQAKFQENAAVTLYYDNSKKFETTSAGVTITGNTSTTGAFVSTQTGGGVLSDNLSLTDNKRVKLGAGDDLQIYHDGTENAINMTNTNANLRIFGVSGSHIKLEPRNGHSSAIFKSNNAVELYFDNSKKFETWTSGARLPSDNNVLAIGAGDDLRFWHNATNSIIRNATGQLQIQSNDLRLGNYNLTESYLKAFQHGAVQIFHDNQMKFETTSNGVDLRGTLHRCEGTFRPYNNNTWDLGTSSDRWRNIYTNDLNLSNEGGANDVDGTCGSYTIQEGAEDLFLINNRSGKKYKFNLTEVA